MGGPLSRFGGRCRYGYKGLGFVGWASDQPSTGVISPPTIATTVQSNPNLGFAYGPHFYLQSFYVTGYCRDYVQVNLTGLVRVSDKN